jgi:nitroreductase
MDVYRAVDQRASVRAFTDQAVDRAIIERVLRAASRAPSGGNVQPWHFTVLTGEPLATAKRLVGQRVADGDVPDSPEYPIYPAGLTSPYRDRRFACGELLYAALGVPREDKAGRLRQFAHNFEFFGAPVGAFCYIDRQMGAAQWSDVGMYLQTVMLLLEAEGLSSCAQEAWSLYHRSVAAVVGPPDELMLFCGMAIGYRDHDHPANGLRMERAPLEETVNFIGWPS